MKIYFYSKKEEDNKEQRAAHEIIFKFLNDNGLTVFSNLLDKAGTEPQVSLENMNGLIIEGKGSAAEAGYLIALSLSQNRPLLYLLPKGKELPEQLRPLLNNDKLKKLFLFKYYSNRILWNILVDYLDIIETGELRREAPTVKFTLRFTPRVDRYLNWKSKRIKIPKTDFLRKLVDDLIKSDEEYQGQLRKGKKVD